MPSIFDIDRGPALFGRPPHHERRRAARPPWSSERLADEARYTALVVDTFRRTGRILHHETLEQWAHAFLHLIEHAPSTEPEALRHDAELLRRIQSTILRSQRP